MTRAHACLVVRDATGRTVHVVQGTPPDLQDCPWLVDEALAACPVGGTLTAYHWWGAAAWAARRYAPGHMWAGVRPLKVHGRHYRLPVGALRAFRSRRAGKDVTP